MKQQNGKVKYKQTYLITCDLAKELQVRGSTQQ